MGTVETVEDEVYEFIRVELANVDAFDRAADLSEQRIVDSLTITRLLGFLEDHFEIEIDLEDVTAENFSTVGAIAALVRRLS